MSAFFFSCNLDSVHRIAYLSRFKTLFILCTLAFAFTGANSTVKAATLNVPAGSDLQAVINSARPGDIIVLEAGATFKGSFVLPNLSGDEWITVTGSAASALPEGVRVSPLQAAMMPKIVSPGKGDAALRTQPGAHHFRFVGIEFKPVDAAAVVYDLIQLGDGGTGQTAHEQIPHHLVFDRCFIHGDPAGTLKRGIALNSRDTEITNSYFAECKARGQDTQAIAGWNGSGNYLIENNYLEASGYPVIFGGAAVHVPGLVPSDIRILRNTFTRPLAWRGVYSVKNLFELKSARRVEVKGNLFENNWVDAQSGYAIVLTVRDEGGQAPQAVVEDVEFAYNIVRHSAAGFNIYGLEGQGLRRVRIHNNLFEDISWNWGGNGKFVQITGSDDVTFDHNTIMHNSSLVTTSGKSSTRFTFTNNITRLNEYGIIGDSVGSGNAALAAYFPQSRVTGNLLTGDNFWRYPSGNINLSQLETGVFTNYAERDYRLPQGSPFKSAGTDGKDLGCDMDAIETAMTGEGNPVAPVLPPLVTLQQVTAAHTKAAALAASSDSISSAQFDSLVDEIEQVNRTAQSEAERLGGEANEVETRLTVALYFMRAARSLARVRATDSSVRSRLQVAAKHLDWVREALQPASLNATSNSIAPNVLALPSISLADTRSSATLASVIAPASAATVMLDRTVTSLSAARVPSSSRASVYELAGISVTVEGRAATLVDVSQSRVGFVVPRESALGEAEVVVTTQSGTIARGTVTVASIAPGIFVKSIGGVGLPIGKGGFTRGGFFRTTTMDASIDMATKLTIPATGFSFAALNTNLANDGRSTSGMTTNLAESVAVEARARDGRTWWLNVEFAGVSQAATGMDQVTVILPPELRNVGTLELTIVIGEMRSNTAQLKFRAPIVQSELTAVATRVSRR